MTTNAHIALTLANSAEEAELISSAPRKSLRRSWNQLPRCQRNLIILGITLICITLFLLLPGEQLTPEHKFLPFRKRLHTDNVPDKTDNAAANALNAAYLDVPDILGAENLTEKKNFAEKLPETQGVSNIADKLVTTSNNKNDDLVADNSKISIEEVVLQQNNNIEPPVEQAKPDQINTENERAALEEAIMHPEQLPGHAGMNIKQYVEHLDSSIDAQKQHFHGANNERQSAVVAAFKHAWTGYRNLAWGHDNLKPLSQVPHDWFHLGLTIVDSLDTMYIMGLEDEFSEARDWVSNHLTFQMNRDVNLFEVTIRVLGGLLSAYHLSGDKMFLQKSVELGNRLLPCFLSPSGIPFSDVNLATMSAHSPKWSPDSSTSEVTTLQLEFRDLSRSTNVLMYERVINIVNDKVHALQKPFGLVPIFINANSGTFRNFVTISLGARGDSYYEYLLKQWIQTGRKENDYLIQDYMRAIDGVQTQLTRRTPKEGYLYIGELNTGHTFKPKMDHLTCYLPGTLLLGHKYGMPDAHLQLAQDLLSTCYQMYMKQQTHLAPEIAYFALNEQDQEAQQEDIYVKSNDAHNLLRPEFIESLYYFYVITGNRTYQDMGWKIFEAFEQHTKVKYGYTSIGNVKNVLNTRPRDMMESFWLGETLKYFYLLFSDNRNEVDLEKWVFNTEAHPLPIRKH